MDFEISSPEMRTQDFKVKLKEDDYCQMPPSLESLRLKSWPSWVERLDENAAFSLTENIWRRS
jgi:hypothetical protein